ncbi:MAG TPA: isochorismatase family protein [Rhizomicrobium sp.]|jgi:nicotinamidase-related amidase
MSFQYAGKEFAQPRPLHTLVLVDVRNSAPQDDDAQPAIAHCRSALRHARSVGLPVCFLHEARSAPARSWMSGMQPTRDDRLFVRRGPSCFDNPYFAEAASGILVLAGFFGRDTIMATARDARRHARSLILLEDAIARPSGFVRLGQALPDSAKAGIRSCPTQSWIDATEQGEV